MQMDWGNNKDMTWTVGSNMYSMGDAKARIIYSETCQDNRLWASSN